MAKKLQLLSEKQKKRKTRRTALVFVLILLIAVGAVSFVLLNTQNNSDYESAKQALEQRQVYIIATYRAQNPP